jgi:hypothetical protein
MSTKQIDFSSPEAIAAVCEALPLANRAAVEAIVSALNAKLKVAIPKEKTVFAVWTNTDLTEGRGQEYVQYLCEKETTAWRLAKKNYVMGTDSRVTEKRLFQSGYEWYGPVRVVQPTKEDERAEEKLTAERNAQLAKEAAIEKAKKLGLTEVDIQALRG